MHRATKPNWVDERLGEMTFRHFTRVGFIMRISFVV